MSMNLRTSAAMTSPRGPEFLVGSQERVSGPVMRARSRCALLLHRLNSLDHLGVFRAVFVPHRLHGGLERLLVGVGDLHDVDAGALRLVHRLLFVLVPEL